MEIYYPSYYKEFRCIAEKCNHSCCIGWEIGVDECIMQKYNSLADSQKSEICKNIHGGTITLTEDGRCPFLDSMGLCKIISSLGEDYISEICREHPRYYNQIAGRNECGLGASCPEACRLILSQNDYNKFALCTIPSEKEGEKTDFNTLKYREKLYRMLSEDSLSYSRRIENLKREFDIPEISAEQGRALISELEYMDEGNKALFSLGREPLTENAVYCERFLAYLIFRHVSVAKSYDNLRARLAFCLLLCGILEDFCSQNAAFEQIADSARVISEEIEYSEDNCDYLIFEFECSLN